MKISTSSISVFICALLLALCSSLFAQTGSYSRDAVFSSPGDVATTLRFTAAIDSIDADTSRTFSLYKWDGPHSWTTYPIRAQRNFNSAAAGVEITTYIDGTFDGVAWTAVDTLGTEVTTEGKTIVEFDLNGKRFPYYRMRLLGSTPNRSDATADWIWYLYHRND